MLQTPVHIKTETVWRMQSPLRQFMSNMAYSGTKLCLCGPSCTQRWCRCGSSMVTFTWQQPCERVECSTDRLCCSAWTQLRFRVGPELVPCSCSHNTLASTPQHTQGCLPHVQPHHCMTILLKDASCLQAFVPVNLCRWEHTE